jgi:GNAT superfamily N-acetyltransferase
MKKVSCRTPVPKYKLNNACSIHTCEVKDLTKSQIIQMGRLSRRGGLLAVALTRFLRLRREKQELPWNRFVIAESQGKILGWGLLQREKNKKASLWMMYVQHAFRRNGIGTKLAKRAYFIHYHNFPGRHEMHVYTHKDQGGFYKEIGIL